MKPILPSSLPADGISGRVPTTRRAWLKTATLATGAAVAHEPGTRTTAATVNPGDRITRGRIRQSIMGWTFNPMPTPELAEHCREIGLVAMEGINPSHYPLIRRLRQYKDYIAHYHTAGVPGRGELDETQELNYPAILRAILETGYEGYVAQEFLPTWPDPILALRHAAKICDV